MPPAPFNWTVLAVIVDPPLAARILPPLPVALSVTVPLVAPADTVPAVMLPLVAVTLMELPAASVAMATLVRVMLLLLDTTTGPLETVAFSPPESWPDRSR